ncbi:MAG: VWA domain-containing protein [Acidobacteriota bacterium]
MRQSTKWCLAAILCGAGLGVMNVTAQVLPPPPAAHASSAEIPTFTSDLKEVTLYVSVLDRDGKMIPDIPRANFKVTENGIEQEIKQFRREDVPVSMCILIDGSGSMKDKHSRVTAAALALVRASNKDDEVCFVNFNDDYYKDQGFTNDITKLEEAMERIDNRGGTAMRDALSATIDYVKTEGKREKKVIVIVTDGNDNASNKTTLEDLLRRVRDSEVLVYSIGLLSEEEKSEANKAKRALNQLAEVSGGFAYYPKDLGDVESITPQIAHEIRNQYMLAYTPEIATLDGSYHRLKVEVKNVPRSTIRHRAGYYAGTPATATPPKPPAAAPKASVVKPNSK